MKSMHALRFPASYMVAFVGWLLFLCSATPGCTDRAAGLRPGAAFVVGRGKYAVTDTHATVDSGKGVAKFRAKADPDEEAIRATGDAVAKPIEAGAKAARPVPDLPDPFRGPVE